MFFLNTHNCNSWNVIQVDLSKLCERAYGSAFRRVKKIRINASCEVRVSR